MNETGIKMPNELEVITAKAPAVNLPALAKKSGLRGNYEELYKSLLHQALEEFPPIEGYETMHALMSERLVYFFCKQKEEEQSPIQENPFKQYKFNAAAFIKMCEAMLKEARSISAEATYKYNLIRQVVEVIDRTVQDPEAKKLVIQELNKLAAQPV
jgi:hypothetical protein